MLYSFILLYFRPTFRNFKKIVKSCLPTLAIIDLSKVGENSVSSKISSGKGFVSSFCGRFRDRIVGNAINRSKNAIVRKLISCQWRAEEIIKLMEFCKRKDSGFVEYAQVSIKR